MAYAIMKINKIKTAANMNARYNHNRRLSNAENVIKDLSDQNESLIPLGTRDGQEMNYYEAWQNRISQLPYYKTHEVRKNAVLGLEVLCSYSKEAENDERFDVEKWKMKTVQWLHNTFNVAGDKRNNLVNVEFHADEVSGPHIHAFVIPVDENGKLNAYGFMHGTLSDLQTSYAEEMESLGLERGLKGSTATPENIRRMYAKNNQAIEETPVHEIGETPDEYWNRAEDLAKTRASVLRRQADDYAVKRRRETDEYIINSRNEASDEIERMRTSAKAELNDIKKETEEAKTQLAYIQYDLQNYQDKLNYTIRAGDELERERKEHAKRYRDLMKGLGVVMKESPEEGREFQKKMNDIMKRSEDWDAFYDGQEAEFDSSGDLKILKEKTPESAI